MFEICSGLSKTDLKIYYFCQYSKKAKNWPNGQTFYFWQTVSGQMATLIKTAL